VSGGGFSGEIGCLAAAAIVGIIITVVGGIELWRGQRLVGGYS
jgi:hypothetical protein